MRFLSQEPPSMRLIRKDEAKSGEQTRLPLYFTKKSKRFSEPCNHSYRAQICAEQGEKCELISINDHFLTPLCANLSAI